MKTRTLRIPFSLAVLLPALLLAGPRDDQWKQVEDAVKKGLPKTAVQRLQPIIDAAIKDKAYAEAIKAIGRKIALEGSIQGNNPEEKVKPMEAEIAKAPPEMRPAMQAILAHWYWHYFQRNRYRFLQRTAEPPGEGFTTWELPRLFAEIDKQFGKALAAADTLKKTPVGQYDDLLVKGNSSDTYGPTLYDFIVHESLAFYNSGEQAGAKAEDAFVLSAGSPVFAPANEFVNWKPESTDEDSPTLKAIRLYQQLLAFHQADDDQTAWLDADLLRLNFGSNKAFGEEKNARYKVALRRFADQHIKHAISSRALHRLASVIHGESDFVEARRIAMAGRNRFPDSVGGKRCHNLIQQIEAKSVQVSVERAWIDPLPGIDVRYRNLTKIYFRVVPYNWLERIKSKSNRPDYLSTAERKALLTRDSVLVWSADFPATDDFQQRLEEIPAPKALKPGSYYLISIHNVGFNDKNNHVQYTSFWVSDLALVLRNRNGEAIIEGFVLQGNSGDPVADAEVRAWRNERNRWVATGTAKTDKNGLFRLKGVNQKSLIFHVRSGDQSLASLNSYYSYVYNITPKSYTRTVFFTDHSLYRPGQTIQYKGLCIRVDAYRAKP